MDRYLCIARLDQRDRLFLWESGDVDRVVLDDEGFIHTFASEQAARDATIEVSANAPVLYDFDAIDAWCASDQTVDNCSPLLDAWNMFGDLPRSDAYTAADADTGDIYNKLFAGCNLPAMTPPHHHYIPSWDASELAALKRVLRLGVAALRARLREPNALERAH